MANLGSRASMEKRRETLTNSTGVGQIYKSRDGKREDVFLALVPTDLQGIPCLGSTFYFWPERIAEVGD